MGIIGCECFMFAWTSVQAFFASRGIDSFENECSVKNGKGFAFFHKTNTFLVSFDEEFRELRFFQQNTAKVQTTK